MFLSDFITSFAPVFQHIMTKAEKLAEKLALQPHPEGGWYKELYRSSLKINSNYLPEWFTEGDKNLLTSIYFLLPEGHFSGLHKIASDEMWYWHEGGPIEIWILSPNGQFEIKHVGPDHDYFLWIPAGYWFGSRPKPGTPYALMSCAVSPGFDFRDFQMATHDFIQRQFPDIYPLIQPIIR